MNVTLSLRENTDEETEKKLLAQMQAEDDAQPQGTILVPPTDDSDVKDIQFNDVALMSIRRDWTQGEYSDPEESETRITYFRCPLCSDRRVIYGGNLWGTSVCCWDDQETECEFQRLIAEHVKAGQSVDEVYEHVCDLLGRESRRVKTGTVREYVERVRDLVIHGRWTERVYPRYQKYLEDGFTGTWLEFFKKEVRQEQAAEAASGCAQIPYVDYRSDCGTFYVGQVEDCSACGATRIGKAKIWNHLKT